MTLKTALIAHVAAAALLTMGFGARLALEQR
jgi:hypothetical protein